MAGGWDLSATNNLGGITGLHPTREGYLYISANTPCAAARAIEDVFDNDQVLAEEMVTTLNHSLVGKYRGLTRAIKFDRTPGPAPFAAPTFGQHTRAVLESAGSSSAEIERLKVSDSPPSG